MERNVNIFHGARSKRGAGFTLIELLCVIGIVAVLLAVVVPGFSEFRTSFELERAASLFSGQVEIARQVASASGAPTEVRWIEISPQVYGIQLWKEEGGPGGVAKPFTSLVRLPDSVVIQSGETSPLLASGGLSGTLGDGPLSGKAYGGCRIRPEGIPETLLDATNNYLTIVPSKFGNASGLPSNYAVVQLHPLNARVLVYRP